MLNVRTRRAYKASAPVPPHALLDSFKRAMKLNTDYDLSLILGVTPSVLSKIRSRKCRVTDEVILGMHEAAPDVWTIARIKQLRDLEETHTKTHNRVLKTGVTFKRRVTERRAVEAA